MTQKQRLRGFTLIELLVVIGIISVLASVILVNIESVREKGNDAARLANLNAMRVALRLYGAANGQYPINRCPSPSPPGWCTISMSWLGYGGHWSPYQAYTSYTDSSPIGTLQTILAPYISQPIKDPTDPMLVSEDVGYLYEGNGTDYCIMVYRVPQNMFDFPKETWNFAPTRCGSVNSAGQCTSGVNSVYYAQGPTWANGCY